jgi:membrane protein YqaA with SNARE-associated domain
MDLATLFLWSFLAATIVPLGSEPALAAIVHRREAVVLPVTVATLGNYLGACTTYALAMTVSRTVKSERALRRMRRASELVRRYGAPALLLSWVPLLGDAIVAAAGAARMNFLPFSLWTIAGKAARYSVLALVLYWGFNDWSIR